MNKLLVLGIVIFGLAIAFIYRLNFRARERAPKDVERLLKTLLDNKYDRDWDDFENTKINNPELENIRQECLKIYAKGSPYIEATTEQPDRLNSAGIEKVKGLINRCAIIEQGTLQDNQPGI